MTPDQCIGQPDHLSSVEALDMVQARYGVEEISDACAVTIASWWQGPTGWGYPFAKLASTGTFNATELLQAISMAREPKQGPVEDDQCLDMLATWAMHRHDELV